MLAYVLTLGRVALAGAFAACAWAAHNGGPGAALTWEWVAVLLTLAGAAEVTDLLDGIVARRTRSASYLGGLLDPLCDSLSRLTMYFAAALSGWVWLAVPLVMVGRDVVVAYVRTVQAHVGGRTSARRSGKAKAVVQGAGILVIVVLAGCGGAWVRTVRPAVGGVVIAVTAWSLVDYLRGGWGAFAQLYHRR